MSASTQGPNGATDTKDPSGFLGEIIGAPVTVKLNSGVVYKGTFAEEEINWMLTTLKGELQSVDGYMNIALEQTKEYVDGKLRRNYGDAFVRGNNGPFECLPAPNLKFNADSSSDVHLGGFMSITSRISHLAGLDRI